MYDAGLNLECHRCCQADTTWCMYRCGRPALFKKNNHSQLGDASYQQRRVIEGRSEDQYVAHFGAGDASYTL